MSPGPSNPTSLTRQKPKDPPIQERIRGVTPVTKRVISCATAPRRTRAGREEDRGVAPEVDPMTEVDEAVEVTAIVTIAMTGTEAGTMTGEGIAVTAAEVAVVTSVRTADPAAPTLAPPPATDEAAQAPGTSTVTGTTVVTVITIVAIVTRDAEVIVTTTGTMDALAADAETDAMIAAPRVAMTTTRTMTATTRT